MTGDCQSSRPACSILVHVLYGKSEEGQTTAHSSVHKSMTRDMLAAVLHKLRTELRFNKYYIMTLKEDKGLEFGPGASNWQLAAIKDITAALPHTIPSASDEGCDGLDGNWMEEVNLYANADAFMQWLTSCTVRVLSHRILKGTVRRTAPAPNTTYADHDRSPAASYASASSSSAASATECGARFACRLPLLPTSDPDIAGRYITLSPDCVGRAHLLKGLRTGEANAPAAGGRQAGASGSSPAGSSSMEASDCIVLSQQLMPAIAQQMHLNFKTCTAHAVEVSHLQPPVDLGNLLRNVVDDRAALEALNGTPDTQLLLFCSLPPRKTAAGGEAVQPRWPPRNSGLLRVHHLALDRSSRELKVLKGLTHEHAFGPRAHERPRLRLIATCHTVAGFLADAFNRQVAEAAPGLPRLEFLKVEIAQYTVEPGEGLPRTTITRLLQRFVAGRKLVFCGSGGYVAPFQDFMPVCDAFPHWTYWTTEGKLIVTDIQGWLDQKNNIVRLTDPCIHCEQPKLLDDELKDRWLVGMEEYFRAHVCGSTCQALGLHTMSEPKAELARIRARIRQAAARYMDVKKDEDCNHIGLLEELLADQRYKKVGARGMEASGSSGGPAESAAPPRAQAPAPSHPTEAAATARLVQDGKGTNANRPDQMWRQAQGVCSEYTRKGSCRFGATCKWLHPDKTVCRSFAAAGNCRYGDNCKFNHELRDVRGRGSSRQGPNTSRQTEVRPLRGHHWHDMGPQGGEVCGRLPEGW